MKSNLTTFLLKTKYKTALFFYLQKEKDVEVFKCDICNLDFTSQAKLEKHRNGHSSKPVKKGIGKVSAFIYFKLSS